MIPPCDPSILDGNPQFKRLHENLTTNLLNPDGSTRVHSADPEVRRDASVKGRAHETIGDARSNHVLGTGPEKMPESVRKEEDQGAYAPEIGVCSGQ